MYKYCTTIALCSLFSILITSTVHANSLANKINSNEPNNSLLPDLFKADKMSSNKKQLHIEEIFHEQLIPHQNLSNEKNRFIYHWEKEDKRRANRYYNKKRP